VFVINGEPAIDKSGIRVCIMCIRRCVGRESNKLRGRTGSWEGKLRPRFVGADEVDNFDFGAKAHICGCVPEAPSNEEGKQYGG